MSRDGLEALRYVAVEGPIGVGKTTLTRRLAEVLGAQPLFEAPERNPFLQSFYADPARWALPTQLSFLMDRVREFERLRQADLFAPRTVADFMFEKDDIFARLTLTEDEYRLYREVAAHVTGEMPTPDLVIYLRAPVSVLQARVAERGIPHERAVNAEYLARLSRAYVAFFHDYTDAPLIILNTDSVDFANRHADFDRLLAHLANGVRGRSLVDLSAGRELGLV